MDESRAADEFEKLEEESKREYEVIRALLLNVPVHMFSRFR